MQRPVEYIEIQRTVPAGEITRFKKFLEPAQGNVVEQELTGATIQYASAVLDKDVSNYRIVHLENNPAVKIYVGKSGEDSY